MNKKQVRRFLAGVDQVTAEKLKQLPYKHQKLLIELAETAKQFGYEEDQGIRGTASYMAAEDRYTLALTKVAIAFQDLPAWTSL